MSVLTCELIKQESSLPQETSCNQQHNIPSESFCFITKQSSRSFYVHFTHIVSGELSDST